MNALRLNPWRAHAVQRHRDSLEVPEPEHGMVRNPRTLMVCSLLALATGMTLGSRLAPPARVASGAPAMVAPGDRFDAWRREAPISVAADTRRADAIEVAAIPGPDAPAGLEGDRHPRMPRMSREAMARSAR